MINEKYNEKLIEIKLFIKEKKIIQIIEYL